jgi:hypothetical protein
METFEYSDNTGSQIEFIGFCSSLLVDNKTSTPKLQEYSSLLNKYYPVKVAHGSHLLTMWTSARSNLDVLFSLSGLKPPKHPTFTSQVSVGVISGLIVGVLLIPITLFLAPPFQNRPTDSVDTMQGKETTPLSTQQTSTKQEPYKPPINKNLIKIVKPST